MTIDVANGTERVWKALDKFRIELPSWEFANTGTRFGKFVQRVRRAASKKNLPMRRR